MYQAQAKEYKHSVTLLDGQISELKSTYIRDFLKEKEARRRDSKGFTPPPIDALPALPEKTLLS